ncbi:hypothetical protein M8J77_023110 [Diaphorina citri]|nr:hypothetical protein M8J77_021757 [Diaphorina citri]KAI5725149.1 hypothetical protein M8J77_011584 [Diaphorina citri]KAI5726031.1 hypothetical protein M8J77_023110 [Diaphorina citri]
MAASWKLFLGLVVLGLCSTSINSYRILGFFPFPIYSHQVPFFRVFDELITRGHDITLVAGFPLSDTDPKLYKYIPIPFLLKFNDAKGRSPLLFAHKSTAKTVNHYSNFCLTSLQNILTTREVTEFYRTDNGTYDLIISEITFCGEPHAALGHKYRGVPVINFQPLGYRAAVFSLYGNLLMPNIMPDVREPFTDRMTFWQSLDNMYLTLWDLWDMYMSYLPQLEEMMQANLHYPGSESRPDLVSLLHSMSLTLVEYDPAILGVAFPIAPNLKFTGGLHLRPGELLSADLESFMNGPGAKGVIFISLGTILQFSHLEPHVTAAFVEALKSLPYAVIWKVDVPVEMPSRVLTGQWFAQQDILGHRNCKLFITHGGIHSSMEAVYHGVPVVMMPGFSDQHQNCKLMEEKGMGLITPHETITGDILYITIREVLNNPRYRDTVGRLSKQVRSLPYSNLDQAVRWAEHVAANKGVLGYTPAAQQTSVMRLLGVELWVIWTILVVLVVVIVMSLIRCLRRCCRKK